MKQSLLIISLIALIAGSCKKQELASDNPLFGKWSFYHIDLERTCNYPSLESHFPTKEVTMEITSGEVIFRFEGEQEKLRIIKISKQNITKKFFYYGESYTTYSLKVKNKSGKLFNFKFNFNGGEIKIIGTYWTPNHIYCSPDRLNCGYVYCTSGGDNSYYYDEVYAVYQKI